MSLLRRIVEARDREALMTTVSVSGPYLTVEALERAERRSVERLARVRDMIGRWQVRLGLTHWDIRYSPGEPEVGSNAEIIFSDSDRAAALTLREELDYQAAEGAVVHELVHAVLRAYAVQSERLLVHVRDDVSRVHFQEMLTDAEEEAIETLVRALVPGAPRVLVPDGGAHDNWAPFQ